MRLYKNKSDKIWDSVLGRYRTGLLFHAGRQSHLNKTLGCTRMDAQDYEEFLKMVEKDAAAGMQNVITIQGELLPSTKPVPILKITKTVETADTGESESTAKKKEEKKKGLKYQVIIK